MHIAVIGSGYVGLVTGACFAEFGVDVACVDVDTAKIANLARGQPTIYEPGLEQLLQKNLQAGRLRFTTDLQSAVELASVVFLAVGTPSKADGSADLTFVDNAAKQVAQSVQDYKVVVMKSTVPVGTGKRLTELIRSNLPKPVEFSVVSNPEFLREGAAISDFMRPDRVVIGSNDARATEIMRELYRPLYLIETPFVITSIEGAELIKYAANAFLATKISFINEVANLCEKVGCDVHEVARAIGMDRRIGSKFLHPGPGFGGSCFPKDTRALAVIGRQYQSPMRIVDAVIEVNEQQRLSMLPKIDTLVEGLSGKRIAVFGLSFKPETDDMRDAPSIDIIRGLIQAGAKVVAYDPVAHDEAARVLPEIEYAEDEYAAATNAEALVFITEWNQFRALDMERIHGLMKTPRIADLRNIYEPAYMRELGFKYVGVGR
jgi:UDPglucose 6-dehydrogenase